MRTSFVVCLSFAFCINTWASQEDVQELVNTLIREARASYSQSESALQGDPHKYPPEAREMDTDYAVFNMVADTLKNKYNMSHQRAHRHVRQTSSTLATCPNPRPDCTTVNPRYYSYDGTCNNINFPAWGSALTAQARLSPAQYAATDEPRGGLVSTLPNARDISHNLHYDSDGRFPYLTNMCVQFGQFLDHDITLTPNANRQCCSGQSGPDCWNIADNWHPTRKCIALTRSTPCSRNGIREQLNANTAFIEGSQIYGSNAQRARQLRTLTNGMLRTSSDPRTVGFLPTKEQIGVANISGPFCAGDDRINENPGLISMHNLFIREHNRIAAEFARRTTWTDEKIYQETRRIVACTLQLITYKEFLPTILSSALMSKYNLNVGAQCSTYNSQINPTILNEFSTAAYRFGHSLIQNRNQMLDPTNKVPVDSYDLQNSFLTGTKFVKDNGQGWDQIMTGLCETNAPYFDPFCTIAVTEHLFNNGSQSFGSDLIARNIQRGRDHGIPSYNTMRQWCGREPVNFQYQPSDWDKDAWSRLKTIYKSPDQIDCFTGMLHELPYDGGAPGFTAQCIIAEQFYRLRYGDRLSCTHCGVYTSAQLAAIINRSFSSVWCNNANIPDAPTHVFDMRSPYLSCSDPSRQLDLTPFITG